MVCLVKRVHLEMMDHLEREDSLELMVHLVKPDRLAKKDSLDLMDPLVK